MLRGFGRDVSNSAISGMHAVPNLTHTQLAIFPRLPRPSPIHKLPVELLRHVFLIGFNDDLDECHFRKTGGEYGPNFEVLISHVCRHWRLIAISTPELWTSILLRDLPHLVQAAVYMERSRHYLLNICIDTVDADHHLPGVTLSRDEFDEVFGIITPHVGRWRTFVLKVRDQTSKEWARALTSKCGPAPNLETLELYHSETWPSEFHLEAAITSDPVTIFDGVLPRLKNASFIGTNLVWDKVPYLSGLKKLKFALHVDRVRPTYLQWERILLSSPELERLSLYYSGPKANDIWPTEPTILACLQDLSLGDMDSDYLCRFLDHTRLPRLRDLHLNLSNDGHTRFVQHVSDPQSPVFRSLEVLRISALDCSAESWREFLFSLPSITTLDVDFRRVDQSFFEELFTTSVDEHATQRSYQIGMDADEDMETDSVIANAFHPQLYEPGMVAMSESSASVFTAYHSDLRLIPLLPRLECFRCRGLSAGKIWRFNRYREGIRHPVSWFDICIEDRDELTDALKAVGLPVRYFVLEDDEDEDSGEGMEGVENDT